MLLGAFWVTSIALHDIADHFGGFNTSLGKVQPKGASSRYSPIRPLIANRAMIAAMLNSRGKELDRLNGAHGIGAVVRRPRLKRREMKCPKIP
jgi:hypothetical protein